MAAGLTRADVRSAPLWFAGALALYLATRARGLACADTSKPTPYALTGHFPSVNPGGHACWTVLVRRWLHLVAPPLWWDADVAETYAVALTLTLGGGVVPASSASQTRSVAKGGCL